MCLNWWWRLAFAVAALGCFPTGPPQQPMPLPLESTRAISALCPSPPLEPTWPSSSSSIPPYNINHQALSHSLNPHIADTKQAVAALPTFWHPPKMLSYLGKFKPLLLHCSSRSCKLNTRRSCLRCNPLQRSGIVNLASYKEKCTTRR